MIYFVQDPRDKRVKIGTTICLSVRHRALEIEHGTTLNVLGVTDGSFADEDALHKRFGLLRIEGEWFRPGSELVDFITTDCRPWDGIDEVPPTRPTKITRLAAKWARIASGYTGESMSEYVSRITLERGREDAERLHAEATKPKPAKKKGEKG